MNIAVKTAMRFLLFSRALAPMKRIPFAIAAALMISREILVHLIVIHPVEAAEAAVEAAEDLEAAEGLCISQTVGSAELF